MKRTLKMKVLSFALAFITAVMLFPYGTLTAYAVNEETEADADENLVNEPLIEENDTATATEPENSTSAPVEEETEIFYDEYEIENTAMSAPPMTQIGGTAEPNALTVLPDGVYEIENVGNDNYYMTVENNYAVAGYRMVQQNYSSNTPLTNFSRSSLFKVSRIGNTNQYVIRSMLNNRMSFTTGTDIDINKFSTGYINTNDSNVNTTYTILQSGGVYTIHPYGSTSVLAAPNTTVSGENDPAAAQLILSTSSAAGNRGKWKFTAYTGNIKYGTARTQTVSMSNGLAEGKNGTVWIKGWSTVIGANTPYMSVESGYTDIAISTWDDYAGGAIVTGKKSGDFRLKAEIRTDPSTAATHTNLYTYTIIPDIVDSTAFIQNVGTGRYVDLEQVNYIPTDIVQQWSFHGGTQSQWIFELGGNGYFKIKSVKTDKYIGVDSSDTTKVKQYTSITDYTLWKLTETSNGRYKISCKASALSGKVLSVPSGTSTNGADLTMLSYTSDSDYIDEWRVGVFVATLNIKLYTDEAYQKRFEDYSSKIPSSMMAIREKYLFDFQILIKYSSINSITSWGDYCDDLTNGNGDSVCPHGDNNSANNASDGLCVNSSYSSTGNANQDLHHKNLYNIVYRIPFPDVTQNTMIVFSGHRYCRMSGENHIGRANGLNWCNEGFILVTNFDSALSERKTILHEIGHWYGVLDHYDIGNAPSSVEMGPGYDPNCIYGENKDSSDVIDNMKICDGCRKFIEENSSEFNH